MWSRLRKSCHATYERNICGTRVGTECRTPFHVSVSVELITLCATSTPERKPSFRQLIFSGIKITRSTSKQGETTGGSSLGSSSQISTLCEGISSTQFKMPGHDPTIRLPEFWGEASEVPEKNLFIYEKI
jgi:hypothetical protein